MNREILVKLAQQADLKMISDEQIAAVEKFTELVIAREREECARMCEWLAEDPMIGSAAAYTDCIQAIREGWEK